MPRTRAGATTAPPTSQPCPPSPCSTNIQTLIHRQNHRQPPPAPTSNPPPRAADLPSRVFGSHLSIAGSMVYALLEAESLGMDTVQVFTKNQQQWKVSPLDPGIVREWHSHLTRLGWHG